MYVYAPQPLRLSSYSHFIHVFFWLYIDMSASPVLEGMSIIGSWTAKPPVSQRV